MYLKVSLCSEINASGRVSVGLYAFHFYSCFNVDHVWRNQIQVHIGKVDACL